MKEGEKAGTVGTGDKVAFVTDSDGNIVKTEDTSSTEEARVKDGEETGEEEISDSDSDVEDKSRRCYDLTGQEDTGCADGNGKLSLVPRINNCGEQIWNLLNRQSQTAGATAAVFQGDQTDNVLSGTYTNFPGNHFNETGGRAIQVPAAGQMAALNPYVAAVTDLVVKTLEKYGVIKMVENKGPSIWVKISDKLAWCQVCNTMFALSFIEEHEKQHFRACPHCGKILPTGTPAKMESHIKTHTKNKISCRLCGDSLCDTDLNRHYLHCRVAKELEDSGEMDELRHEFALTIPESRINELRKEGIPANKPVPQVIPKKPVATASSARWKRTLRTREKPKKKARKGDDETESVSGSTSE